MQVSISDPITVVGIEYGCTRQPILTRPVNAEAIASEREQSATGCFNSRGGQAFQTTNFFDELDCNLFEQLKRLLSVILLETDMDHIIPRANDLTCALSPWDSHSCFEQLVPP